MTNYEHYKDEIIEALLNCNACEFIATHTNIIKHDCTKVLMNECAKCDKTFREWLNSEYKEPIKLTQTEYHILKGLDERFKYITKSTLGTVLIHTVEPYKDGSMWDNPDELWGLPYNHLFKFIKWEDKEPYSIEELLKCEVVEDES